MTVYRVPQGRKWEGEARVWVGRGKDRRQEGAAFTPRGQLLRIQHLPQEFTGGWK